MVVGTLSLSAGSPTSSLDALTWLNWEAEEPWEYNTTSRDPKLTVGGDYALSSVPDDADEEARWWAELARRARERWAKENPF